MYRKVWKQNMYASPIRVSIMLLAFQPHGREKEGEQQYNDRG